MEECYKRSKTKSAFFRMKILRAKKSEFTKIALHLKCFFSKLYEYSLKIVMILETDL